MYSMSPKSPNFWVLVASALAILGFLVLSIGWLTQVVWLKTAGWIVIMPIIAGGIVLAVIVIPVLIILTRSTRKR